VQGGIWRITADSLKKIAAGLFFIASLGLIIISIFIIGIDRGLTEPKFQVIVLFNQVGGLVEGAPYAFPGLTWVLLVPWIS